MPLIDDRGRLFGKINLIDFALILFIVLLLPLGYGAFALFRTPTPTLLGVSPTPLIYRKGEQRIRISGTHLRPFLRASIGKADARGFLIESPTAAEVIFDDVPPGTYDVALFDPSEEVARLQDALTIVPPPAPPVQFVGRFTGANAADAALAVGSKLGDPARPLEVLEIGPPGRGERSATLRGPCDVDSAPCTVAHTAVEIGKPVPLKVQGHDEALSFVVDQIRMDALWVEVHVRLFGIAEVLDLIKIGDVDRFNDLDASGMIKHGATVQSLEASQPTDGAQVLNFTQGLVDSAPFGGSITVTGRVPVKTRMAVLRMPLQRLERGFKYRDQYIRPGSSLAFETPDYFARGLITRVVAPEPPRDRTDQ
jgi:hypothetical protein